MRVLRRATVFILITATVLAVSVLSAGRSAGSGKSFLWKIRSDTTTAFLLGSIHFFREDLYPLGESIESSFSRSDVLVVEIDMNEIDPADVKSSFLKGSMHSGSIPLKERLSGPLYERTRKMLSAHGLDIRQFDMFKPSMIAVVLTGLELNRHGFRPEHGIDLHFLKKAKGRKQIIELETLDLQAEMLNTLSDPDQELFLSYTLADLEIVGSQLDSLVKYWSEGDARSMENLLRRGLTENPEAGPVYRKVIDERNVTMAKKIDSLLRTDKVYFVVVGAAHLIGDNGIISILDRKGYSVEQM